MTDNVSAGSNFHQEQFDDYYPEIKIIELQCINLHNNDCTFECCVARLWHLKLSITTCQLPTYSWQAHVLLNIRTCKTCWSPTMKTSHKKTEWVWEWQESCDKTCSDDRCQLSKLETVTEVWKIDFYPRYQITLWDFYWKNIQPLHWSN